jgi:hypothetical protein
MKNIQMSDELYEQVAKLAEADHVSVDRLVSSLVSERVGDWIRLEARASRGSLEKLSRVLSKVPNVEPDSHDRI